MPKKYRRGILYIVVAAYIVLSWAFVLTLRVNHLTRANTKPIKTIKIPVSLTGTAEVIAYAYSSSISECDGNPFNNASMTRPHQGSMACNFLPMGTIVLIKEWPGRVFHVDDRMNSRYTGKYIDIWVKEKVQADFFGKRKLHIVYVKPPTYVPVKPVTKKDWRILHKYLKGIDHKCQRTNQLLIKYQF